MKLVLFLKGNGKFGSVIGFAFAGNVPIHQLSIFRHNVQTQTSALYIKRIGRPEKPFKQMLLVIFRNADATVFYPELNFIIRHFCIEFNY